MAATPPRIVGRYALYGALAQGGMATVHLGCLRGPVGFSRIVAIKRMLPQYAQSPDFVAMFLEEARLAGRVRHPNVVPVIDVVAEDGEVLLVMEYVRGETVSRLVREPIPGPIAATIACDALDGLHAAHEALDDDGKPLGIVHRDVSPQNIIVGVDGIARVLDFGIAKAIGRAHVTREGQLKGKLAYMAPEQLHGKVTRVSDIYSAGVVLWEMLAGKRLFNRESEGETMHAILHDAIAAPGTAYDDVLLRALARDPNDRFTTAREMSLALAKCAARAEPHEVGEWLEVRAKDGLASRHELASEVETAATEAGRAEPRRRFRAWPLIAGVLVVAGAGVGATWLLTRSPAPIPLPPAVPASAQPSATVVQGVTETPTPSATASVITPLAKSADRPTVKRIPTASASVSVRIPEFL